MTNNINGETVEVSANINEFNKVINEAKANAKSATKDLATLQKSLQLDFNDEKFAKAQKVAQKAIDETAKAAETLKEKMQYLERCGNIDTDEYKNAQRDINEVELKAAALQNQLGQINQISFDRLSQQVTSVGNDIQKAGNAITPFSALATKAVTALGKMGVTAASTGAELNDMSLRLGISAEKVQEYRYVTAQAGVEWSVFEKAIINARSAMLDMSTGTISTASQALQSLGLNVADFESKEAMFDGIIDALSKMQDKTLQAAYANEIFGDEVANQMLPYLNAGGDAISQFKTEFGYIGALSNEQVVALADLDNTLRLLKKAFKNVTTQIGASLSPLIKNVADSIQKKLVPRLQQLANWFNSLSLGQQKVALTSLVVVAALAPLTLGIGKLVTAVGSIINVLPKLGEAMSTLAAHPIILIIAAVAAVLLLLYTQCESFRESINNLVSLIGSALQPILEVVMQLLKDVMGAISPIIEMIGQLLSVVVNLINGALQMVVEIITDIFSAISPLIDIIMTMLNIVLTPLKSMLSVLLAILQPILSVALIPLQLALKQLQIPLQMIGQLLSWLAPLFGAFAKIVQGVFGIVLDVINTVLGAVEEAINWCITKINKLIDGINKSMGWLGVNISRIQDVSLKINTSFNIDDKNLEIDSTPSMPSFENSDIIYGQIGASGTTGDIYSNDYSTTNKTQNITVVIENYASEVDVDDLVNQINIKLAEAM